MFDRVWKVTHLSLFPVSLSLERRPRDCKCYICRYHFSHLSKFVVSVPRADGWSDHETAKRSVCQELSLCSTWVCSTATLWLNSWDFTSSIPHVHLNQLLNQLFSADLRLTKPTTVLSVEAKKQEMSPASRSKVVAVLYHLCLPHCATGIFINFGETSSLMLADCIMNSMLYRRLRPASVCNVISAPWHDQSTPQKTNLKTWAQKLF